jgi:hypothetical protein
MEDLLMAPASTFEGGLPDLVPSPERKAGKVKIAAAIDAGEAQRAPIANPCNSVTKQSITEVRDGIERARQLAEVNAAANGEGVPDAVYPGAATYSLRHISTAREWMDRLLRWLADNDLFEGADQQVNNTTAAYNVYGYCRETVVQLHHGRHWAAVSAASNSSRKTADPARECVERGSEALAMLDPLSAQATRCYLRAYFL